MLLEKNGCVSGRHPEIGSAGKGTWDAAERAYSAAGRKQRDDPGILDSKDMLCACGRNDRDSSGGGQLWMEYASKSGRAGSGVAATSLWGRKQDRSTGGGDRRRGGAGI